MKFVIVKIQRPGRLMCQNSYMSMEMCFQNISQRECYYRNCITMLLTLWKVQSFLSQQRSIYYF